MDSRDINTYDINGDIQEQDKRALGMLEQPYKDILALAADAKKANRDIHTFLGISKDFILDAFDLKHIHPLRKWIEDFQKEHTSPLQQRITENIEKIAQLKKIIAELQPPRLLPN